MYKKFPKFLLLSFLRHAADIAFLRAAIFLLKGDLRAARRHILLAVHRQPWLATLWQVLARFILQNYPSEAAAAAAASRRAGRMEQRGGDAGAADSLPRTNHKTDVLGQ